MTEYLTGPRRLPPGFDLDAHLARLDEDGFTIVDDYMSEDQLARFREGLKPYLGSYRGRNPFEGLATERVYTLVGRGKVYEEIASDHRLLAILDGLLAPNYLLSADHAICIYPGEEAQALHFDDSFYPFLRPRRAISISVIGAIDAFMPENGGTVLYPGSHKWSSERIQAVREALARGEMSADAERRTQLAMPAGAICVFQGTLLHGGGANRTDAPRLSFTNQYCEPWARPQKNFFLGVPKEKVRGMSREIQILLGYELRRPGDIMGQVGGYHPIKTLDPDFVLPVLR
jgi:ectoine hydroxylase-related dioxygenase (phytanoyl-CoA dioxygenase family)